MRLFSLVAASALVLVTAACESPEAAPQPASKADGDTCFQRRNWSCATQNYVGYLKAYPNDPATNAKAGIAMTYAGQHREALPYYKRAEELGVVTYDMYANYALSLDASGDLDGAIRANEKALELVPGLVDVRGSLAAQLVRKGKTQEAIKLLEEFDAHLKRNGEQPYFKAQIASIKEKAAQ